MGVRSRFRPGRRRRQRDWNLRLLGRTHPHLHVGRLLHRTVRPSRATRDRLHERDPACRSSRRKRAPCSAPTPSPWAVPDGSGGVSFQFDFSTSAVALGTITRAKAAGESIPLGWAVDGDGNPTTDPAAALEGSLQSAGGYKGYGFGLMVELLASALTGGRRSVDVPPLKAPTGEPHDLGQFYIVVDPGAYSGGGFHDHLVSLAASIADQPGARLPGQNTIDQDPVQVEDDVWALVTGLAG